MVSNEFLAREIVSHGAYLCGRRVDGGDVRGAGAGRIAALAARRGLHNEFEPGDPPSRESIAFMRRQAATAGDVVDDDVLQADWVVHVASAREAS
jgi:hypothetical protein